MSGTEARDDLSQAFCELIEPATFICCLARLRF
jgi:hypothetical protein